jgi:hypothetical protein
MKTVLLGLITGMLCLAQFPSSMETGGALNGRFWTGLQLDGKRMFLTGYAEGLHVASASDSAYDQIAQTWLPQHGITDDAVKGVDKFYVQPENLRLPIIFAIRVFAMQIAGRPQAEIDRVMVGLRGAANAAEKKNQQ